jgi:hypothetical protein
LGEDESGAGETGVQHDPAAPSAVTGKIGAAENAAASRQSDARPSKDNLDRELVLWTRVLGVFTGLLFLASCFQFVVLHGQQTVMQGQLDEMKNEQRPWLKADPKITSPLVSKGGLLFTNIAIAVTNVGHIPASGVRGEAMLLNGGHSSVTREDFKFVCKQADTSLMVDKEAGSDVIFPSGSGFLNMEAPDERSLGRGPDVWRGRRHEPGARSPRSQFLRTDLRPLAAQGAQLGQSRLDNGSEAATFVGCYSAMVRRIADVLSRAAF